MASVLELPDVQLSAHRQIVVQDIRSSNIKVLWKMSMAEICAVMFNLDKTAPNFSTKQAAALRTLGSVQKLDFFDSSTLHASGMVVLGSHTVPSAASSSVSGSSSSGQHQGQQQSSQTQQQQHRLPQQPSFTTEERFEYLVVQFTSRTVILNLRQGPQSHSVDPTARWIPASDTRRPTISPYIPVVAEINEKLLKALPTSIALPLTPNLLLIGCSDGSVRVYDWKAEEVLKSSRGPSGKNDAIWHLVAANPYNQLEAEEFDSILGGTTNSQKAYFDVDKVIKRVISVSKKGTAYLWEIVLQRGTLIDIYLPVAKMEGLIVPNSSASSSSSDRRFGGSGDGVGSSNNTALSSSGVGSSSGSSQLSSSNSISSSGGTDSAVWEHTLVEFDAHRQLFFWFVPTGYKNNSKPHLLVFDLTESSALKRHKKTVVPKQEPYVVSFPTVDVPFTIVPGWLHPAFPHEAITCALVATSGDLILQAVARKDCKHNRVSKATPYFVASVPALVQKDAGCGGLPLIRATSLLSLRRIDPTILMVGTSNMGYLQVVLEPNDVGPRHAHLGAAFGNDFGESALFVEHSSVIWAPLMKVSEHSRRGTGGGSSSHHLTSNSKKSILMGRIGVQKNRQVPVYKSPPPQELHNEVQKRSVRLPPRFIPSPSGNYLCLYWPDERRYEILHMATIMRRANVSATASATDSYSPAVASGTRVLDFAWVRDDDVFCLLHPPLESKAENSTTSGSIGGSTLALLDSSTSGGSNPILSSASSVGGSVKGAFRKGLQIGRGRLSSSNQSVSGASFSSPAATGLNNATNDHESKTDGSRFLPRVELKSLIGVNANAAEHGSVAAATARSLGDITLRGGNRNPPSALFGGPVLCVASKGGGDGSGAKNGFEAVGEDGGSAYFYTKKPGTDARDHTYVSAGPNLPYPDFVEWDEDGKLCAVVVQGLVAVYLSEQPQFVLLGSIQLGAPTERNVKVTGLTFIHGVLYCSTRTTVQCIFLGDIVEDGICHLDTFILTSAEGPSLPHRSFSLTPTTVPMTLNHPVVLGYQSGSLLVSTVTGLCAIPLHHPLLRIGALIAAGLHEKAVRWFDAVPASSHEALAAFLDRRGCANLAVKLSGLSLETMVDMALRYGLTDTIVDVVEQFGLDGLRKIDMGRGVSVGIVGSEEHDHSIVVCIGAFLLANGRIQLVKELAEECLEEGCRNEAFVLGSLLMSVESDSQRVVQTAVGQKLEKDENSIVIPIFEPSNDYPVTSLVRENIL